MSLFILQTVQKFREAAGNALSICNVSIESQSIIRSSLEMGMVVVCIRVIGGEHVFNCTWIHAWIRFSVEVRTFF